MDIINLKEEPNLIPTLAKWHHNEWSYLNPSLTLNERIYKMEAYLSNEIIPSTYIAKENNILLGSSALIEHDMETNKHLTPWLASIYVAEPHRKQGIGSKLVLHAMKEAKKENISKLYLFTPDQENFYKNLGWSTIEKERYHNHNVVIMEVTLRG